MRFVRLAVLCVLVSLTVLPGFATADGSDPNSTTTSSSTSSDPAPDSSESTVLSDPPGSPCRPGCLS
ncbi:MAG: hypothetical protein WDA16_09580 [Candidatus Thermoplasmatota archaeon]